MLTSTYTSEVLSQNALDLRPDFGRLERGVQFYQDSLSPVVSDYRLGVFVEGRQPLAQGLLVVVAALNQRIAGFIIYVRDFRRLEFDMIRATTCRMDASTRDTAHQQVVIKDEVKHAVEVLAILFEHLVELLLAQQSEGSRRGYNRSCIPAC